MKIPLRMDVSKSAVASIKHVAMIPEVGQAVKAWVDADGGGVLIGGLAMSFYAAPRATQDVDVLFLSQTDIPKTVQGFKRTRKGAFQDNKEHVEVEVVHPEFLKISHALAKRVYDTAKKVDGFRVASAEGLVALKLAASDEPRRRLRDLGDVERIIENVKVDMSGWGLTKPHQEIVDHLLSLFWSK